MKEILEVKNLSVSFKTTGGEVKAVRNLRFNIREGESVAIVGESGSGKSVTAQSLMRLISQDNISDSSTILFQGEDLLLKSEREMQSVRGKRMGMVFQDPLSSLNPTLRIRTQMIEGVMKHEGISKVEAEKRAIEMLELVGIANPHLRMSQYAFELSGGIRQRIVIAMVLMCHPQFLILDEPTTALDTTIQAQVLDLLKHLQQKFSMSVLLITHDLGVVARMCERVIVMYGGQVMEEGSVEQIFYSPKHPYTQALLSAILIPDPAKEKEKKRIVMQGDPFNPLSNSQGCPLFNRCPHAMEICRSMQPKLSSIAPQHTVACHLFP